MEFWKGVWGFEACISQIRRQKSKFTKQATYPEDDYTVFRQECRDDPIRKITKHWINWKIQQTQQNYCVERCSGIGNITSLMECTGRHFTAPTRHKQLWCGSKGSVWMSLFMDGSGKCKLQSWYYLVKFVNCKFKTYQSIDNSTVNFNKNITSMNWKIWVFKNILNPMLTGVVHDRSTLKFYVNAITSLLEYQNNVIRLY